MAKPKLSEYSAKRRFASTPEPAPAPAPGRGPLLFVVQMHAASRLHYDVRLECDGVLVSWAVPKGPSLNPADKRMAVRTEDHPYDYGSFEGVIPAKQYGAGEVIVWDCGVYTPDETGLWYQDRRRAEREIREGLVKGKLSITLRGEKLKGSFALVRMAKDPKTWLLIKHKDRFVSTDDVTARNRSVLSNATVEELTQRPTHRLPASRLVPAGAPAPMPREIAPMHAELAVHAINDPRWMWEPKLDGYRVMAFIDGDTVTLRSRRGLDYTRTFPRLVAELKRQFEPLSAAKTAGQRAATPVSRPRRDDRNGPTMILDGEIVALDPAGRPSFNALQNRVGLKTDRELAVADIDVPAVFYAFDLLYFAGIDVRDAPYTDRRRYLAQCLLPTPLVQLIHATEDGVGLYQAALASGFEGVIGKRRDSRYETGKRSGAWIKVKPTHSEDFVIGGYTRGKGAREDFGALLVGYWDGGKLQFVSNVGTGFDERLIGRIKTQLDGMAQAACPFATRPPQTANAIWVRPELACEVKFQEWTEDERLRAPVFVRLRDDLDPKEIRKASSAARRRRTGAAAGAVAAASVAAVGAASAATVAAKAAPTKKAARDIDDVLAQLDSPKNDLTLACGPHHIKVTNLSRVYWPADPGLKQPAVTKRDLLRYLAQVSPYMIPHLAERPLTMIRMPAGIGKQRFFQKHWEQSKPDFVEEITVYSDSNQESGVYLLCNNLPTLLWLGQSGTLEFHIWHSRAQLGADSPIKGTDYASSTQSLEESILNYPDYVVFDIDPYIYSGKEKKGDEPELNTLAFEKGKEVAFWLRELLQGMQLEPIVKTSGKTGLHVFVPIRRTIDFDAARHVTELVGRHLMRLHPKDITMEWSIPKRTGKIFMDYNMNVRGKTLNVAYSPRGAPGAPVSMPLTWEELARAHPLDFRMTNVPARLAQAGDRWADALKRKQSLEQALKGKV